MNRYTLKNNKVLRDGVPMWEYCIGYSLQRLGNTRELSLWSLRDGEMNECFYAGYDFGIRALVRWMNGGEPPTAHEGLMSELSAWLAAGQGRE